MVQVTTRNRVDAFWSSTLGVEATELHVPGTRVCPHVGEREQWRGIYVLAFDDAVSVFAPAEEVEQVRAKVGGRDAKALLEPETWRELLGSTLRGAFGPVAHFYLDDRAGLEELAEGRRITPDDAAALADLRRAVRTEEWGAAGFTAQPSALLGLFAEDRLIAAANLTSGPEASSDIGIVIHPDARGKGMAVRIAAAAAKQAIALHGLARFRVLTSSAPTLAIAHRLGFTEYGQNLVAYLFGSTEDS
jgi:GNAT superfamily N-acetyltransferase